MKFLSKTRSGHWRHCISFLWLLGLSCSICTGEGKRRLPNSMAVHERESTSAEELINLRDLYPHAS